MIGYDQFQSDINCLQEINQDTNQMKVKRDLRQAVYLIQECRGDTIQMTSSPRKIEEGIHKYGGTMIHMKKQWAGSNIERGNDRLGRYSKVTLTGKDENKITIYYQFI